MMTLYFYAGLTVIMLISIMMRDPVDRLHRMNEIVRVQIILYVALLVIGYMLFGK